MIKLALITMILSLFFVACDNKKQRRSVTLVDSNVTKSESSKEKPSPDKNVTKSEPPKEKPSPDKNVTKSEPSKEKPSPDKNVTKNEPLKEVKLLNPVLKELSADGGKRVYDLWTYMLPIQSDKRYFVLQDANLKRDYIVEYQVFDLRVEEREGCAEGEKMLYKKEPTNITVRFEKNAKVNGLYQLHRKIHLKDIITVRASKCRLINHYDRFSIVEGITFDDVIEIQCGDSLGYYQKDFGEIAEVENNQTHAYFKTKEKGE